MNKKQEIDLIISETLNKYTLKDRDKVEKYINRHLSKIQYEFEINEIDERKLFSQTLELLVELFLEKE